MSSRMDRYRDKGDTNTYSRANRNQELYQNIGSNTRVANLTDVTNANAIDLDNASRITNTREGYHQMKEFRKDITVPKVKKELDDFNYLYQTRENRIYDVNRVLEEARKNRRTADDEKEEKRRLKNSNYNIITSLNPEELEKYRQEKINRVYRANDDANSNDDDIKELINTIASKTLAGEIDQATGVNLLSDLMATSILDKVERQKEDTSVNLGLSREILNKEQIEQVNKLDQEIVEEKERNLKEADSDFYTRSMDLSDKDFEMDEEFKEKSLPLPLKIILILLVLACIAAAVYFIWQTYFK
jgi:DNA-binding transcriptional regulator/RsmH inhibitor MraZ